MVMLPLSFFLLPLLDLSFHLLIILFLLYPVSITASCSVQVLPSAAFHISLM